MDFWQGLSLRQRKLLVGSLAHKLNVIHRIEMKSLTMIQAARELGVTASAVSQMMDPSAVSALRAYRGNLLRKRMRSGKHAVLEEELNFRIANVNAKFRITGVGVSIAIILMKAQEIAAQRNIDDFTANTGWVSRFLMRSKLVNVQLYGQAGSVDLSLLTSEIQAIRDTVSRFRPECVFNMDESGSE